MAPGDVAAIGDGAGVPTGGSPVGALDDELDEIAGHLNAQHARLVQVAAALAADERRWTGPGVHSLPQFLAWRAAISPGHARQVADVAARSSELPTCFEAFRAGELSLDQMAVIARHAPWWADAEVCDLAKMATVRQLRRALSGYPFPEIPAPGADADEPSEVGDRFGGSAPDGQDAPAGHTDDRAASDDRVGAGADADGTDECETGAADGDERSTLRPDPPDHCSFFVDDDGRFRLRLETDALTGSLIEAALVEARDALFRSGQHDTSWVDAAREIAERSLDGVRSTDRRSRFRINIHLESAGGASDAVGARLPDVIRRQVTCDGSCTTIRLEDGVPVSVGRAQHIVPDRTRRLVVLRDQGCAVPGCTQHRFLEVHHIIHWLDGGPTDTWNLICLCPHHHRLHHRGRLGIAGNADQPGGVTFTTVHHQPIRASGARPEPPGAPPSPPVGTYRHPDGARLDPRWLYFNPPPAHRVASGG